MVKNDMKTTMRHEFKITQKLHWNILPNLLQYLFETLQNLHWIFKKALEDTFLKNLPTAAALSLPKTDFLPSAPA